MSRTLRLFLSLLFPLRSPSSSLLSWPSSFQQRDWIFHYHTNQPNFQTCPGPTQGHQNPWESLMSKPPKKKAQVKMRVFEEHAAQMPMKMQKCPKCYGRRASREESNQYALTPTHRFGTGFDEGDEEHPATGEASRGGSQILARPAVSSFPSRRMFISMTTMRRKSLFSRTSRVRGASAAGAPSSARPASELGSGEAAAGRRPLPRRDCWREV